MQKIKLNIAGMTCVNCSNAVMKVAKKIDGVGFANVNFANGVGEFEIKDEQTLEILKERIKKLGYEVIFDASEFEKRQNDHVLYLRNHFFIALVLSALIMGLEMLLPPSFAKNLGVVLLGFIVLFYNGKSFFSHAFLSLKSKNYDMNVLVCLGATSAFIHAIFMLFWGKFLDENLNHLYISGSAMIITFVLLGKFLEARSKSKAMDHLKILMDMSPKTALLIKSDGQTEQVSVNKLQIGDVVAVKNGYGVPSDGVIVQGGAEIDTSALTGESLPSYKKVGDEVFSGTLNTNGYISVRITKLANQTLLAQILALLSDAATKQMPISRLADRVANIFVPSVIFISILTFFTWILLTKNFTYATLSAVCVLIISCPCALGLATPIAVISGLSRAAKDRVLIKNPQILEILKDVKFAVFDKTGTLTSGKIAVSQCSLSEADLSLISGVEALSEHPISKAIVNFAKDSGIKIAKLNGVFENIVGFGVIYKDENHEIIVGNARLLEREGIEFLSENESQKGQIFCAINKKFIGVITINDEIRSEAKAVIDALRTKNITPVMLSGDNEGVVSNVADRLGISEFYANMLPQDKLNVVKKLGESGKVIFIGDGINDSLSLKQADIGVAIGSGADIAKGASDVVLIKNDLRSVIFMLNLGEKSIKIIKQNLFWAFIYNLICIPIAAGALYPAFGVLLNPMFGALSMCFSSVNIVLNSLRLRFAKF
ncbi:heavy metal translocating P-type ATPase [Campylobacter gastrosuis]|uniref:Copper-transporting ATPase n=1 Tax=Campylobacter gastrosuis TaxID=2974576 RepID=A0ABT7HP29_9BACT|nr:cation-translocating P-type ATPase [Campylobacter gastrosuis]MDL0088584.1 cation-translocating P-type ATPase [Campylobacter gastrosuis]